MNADTQREQRQFWCITEQNTVRHATGYRCNQTNNWWIPQLGYTGAEGISLFPDKGTAVAQLRANLQQQIATLIKQLNAL